MFQFKNGRLYANVTPRTLSFRVPEGFWINTYPDLLAPDQIAFYTADKQIEIYVSVYSSNGRTTEEDACKYFYDTPANCLDGPYAISISGFDGHCIYCLDAGTSQYTVSLDISDGGFVSDNGTEQCDRIEVTVIFYGCVDRQQATKRMKTVLGGPDFVSMFESIRVTEKEAE